MWEHVWANTDRQNARKGKQTRSHRSRRNRPTVRAQRSITHLTKQHMNAFCLPFSYFMLSRPIEPIQAETTLVLSVWSGGKFLVLLPVWACVWFSESNDEKTASLEWGKQKRRRLLTNCKFRVMQFLLQFSKVTSKAFGKARPNNEFSRPSDCQHFLKYFFYFDFWRFFANNNPFVY